MEEQQEQNQEEQPKIIVEQPKKNIIPTRLGSLIVLLAATIAGTCLWWSTDSYIPPEAVDVSKIVEQIKQGAEVKNELPEEYEIKADGVYYEGELIEGADPETFEYVRGYYSKDKDSIYYYSEGGIIETDLDPDSFQVLVVGFIKDKNGVYDLDLQLYPEYNTETFEVVKDIYGGGMSLFKDKNGVYLYGRGNMQTIQDINPKILIFIDAYNSDGYIKDVNTVYYSRWEGLKEVVGADAKTFKGTPEFSKESYSWEIPPPFYEAEDVNHKYLYGRMIAEVQKSGLVSIGGGYYKDEKNVYFVSLVNCGSKVCEGPLLIMDELDQDTFEFLGECWSNEPVNRAPDRYFYIKDKDGVYCGNVLIKEADPETFEFLGNARDPGAETVGFARDKNYIFRNCVIIEDKNLDTFEVPEEYEGRACLASGTEILMSDGNYKNIENIKVGDLVTSYEIETKEYTTSKVDKVIKRKDPLVIINNTLQSAPDEPVYLADGTVKEAIDIKIGDYLVNEKGKQVRVDTIENNAELVDTYDFTLENGYNFFADGYLVGTPDL